MTLSALDWALLFIYFTFVLGIGVALRRYTRTSTDFFQAGRALPAWVCGLAFISANLGAQELIGMAASGAKYGIATSHFYWIGADPGDVVRRHLHDALLLRLARPLGPGIPPAPIRRENPRLQRRLVRADDGVLVGHLDVRDGQAAAAAAHPRRALRGSRARSRIHLPRLHRRLGGHRARLHPLRRTVERHLQRSPAVLPDRRRLPAARVSRPARCRRLVGDLRRRCRRR